MVMYSVIPKYCVTRPNKRSGKPRSNKGQNKQWANVQLGSFQMSFPKPRIPQLLGSARTLSNAQSVYPQVKLDLPISSINFAVVAGALASSVALNFSLIRNWTTRFASLFREYAIVGAKLELRINNVVAPAGVITAFIEEQVATVATADRALARPRLDLLIAAQSVPGAYTLTWTPRDILDLDFVDTATSFAPCYLDIYTDVANFGTLNTTTCELIVTGAIAFEFRGFV